MSIRVGTGLALSGGGFRASLFHLGSAQRLHELGILRSVTQLSTVSGGSVFAGHLAESMMKRGNQKNLDLSDWERDVARPFRQFVSKDIGTKLALKYLLWGQLKPTLRAYALRDAFYHRLTKLRLKDLTAADVEFVDLHRILTRYLH